MKGWVEKTAPGVSSATVKLSIATGIALWLGAHCWRGIWFLARQWPLYLAFGLAWLGLRIYDGFGVYALAGAGAGLVLTLLGWALLHRRSFDVVVYWPLRGWWRGLVIYALGWQELMAVCDLSKKIKDVDHFPRLIRTRSTSTVDRVRVKTLRGQTLADYAENTTRFYESAGTVDCRVRRLFWPSLTIRGKRLGGKVRARVLDLWFLVADPLAELVPLGQVPEKVHLKRLPMALREDGLPWALRLAGNHVLVVGRTGAGKGSVLWGLVRVLGPAIRSRLVELWVIDPKGGMEFAAGQALFTRYSYGDRDTDADGNTRPYQEDYAEFLEALGDRMRARQKELRGWSRTHKAKPGDPHIVVMVDELAALTAYVTESKLRKRIESALSLLLSQGRAVGISVIGATQDARKEVISGRGLFPTRIALGLSEEAETDLVLGSTARKNGAKCEEISEDTPGVAFVQAEDSREPVRIRFPYVDDDEITRMSSDYRPGAVPLHAVDDTDEEEAA